MKKLIFAAAATLSMFFGCIRPSHAEVVYNAELVADSCIGANTNYDLNLQRVGATYLSFVAAYSTTTLSAKTFVDGRKSTATITVENFTALIAAKASVRLTLLSPTTAQYANDSVTLNGIAFREGLGKEWQAVSTATGTAIALAAAIDANTNFDAVAVSTVVYATSTVVGKFANAWTAASSDSLAISTSAPLFTGGADNERLAINGVAFTQGSQYTAATSSAATASSICAGMIANSTQTISCSTTSATPGVVFLTTVLVGVGDYSLYTSTPFALRVNGSASVGDTTMTNGLASKVDLATEIITIANHGYGTGADVLYSTAGVNTITGLTNQTTYYVIKVNYDQLKLASSRANAAAGTAVNLTAQAGGQTFTLTPVARTGNPSFKWQVSNNSTYFDLAVTSVTITTTDSLGWNFGNLPYKTLRLKYTAPTTGCGAVTATGSGTR